MLRLPARSKKRNGPQESGLPASVTPVVDPPEPAADASDLNPDQIGPTPPFLSLREAADWLCVSSSTLKRMITQGLLPTIRIGRRRKIPANALSAYVTKDLTFPDEVVDTTENVEDSI